MKKKPTFYYVLDEHRNKIESNNLFNASMCYKMLSKFTSVITDKTYVHVSSTNLQDITPEYKLYLDYLIHDKLIYIDNNYTVGRSTRGYKLRTEFTNPMVHKILSTDVNHIKKINERRLKTNSKMNNLSKKEQFKLMKKYFVEFCGELPIDEILQDINQAHIECNAKVLQYMLVDKIGMHDFYFSRNKTNKRLDTNLTNLSSGIKFYNPRSYTNLDFSNSQPYFLNLLLQDAVKQEGNKKEVGKKKQEGNKKEVGKKLINSNPYTTFHHNVIISSFQTGCNPSINQEDIEIQHSNILGVFIDEIELDKYSNWVTSGKFYDNFMGDIYTRKQIKDMMFCILFSKNTSYRKEKAIFKIEFPTIYKFICEFKTIYGYESLAITLQLIESHFVLDVICPLLVAEDIFNVTIHDSWIVKDKDVERAKEIILSVFDIKPNLKEESFNKKREEKINEFKNNGQPTKINMQHWE